MHAHTPVHNPDERPDCNVDHAKVGHKLVRILESIDIFSFIIFAGGFVIVLPECQAQEGGKVGNLSGGMGGGEE